jgi:hypothetical protein
MVVVVIPIRNLVVTLFGISNQSPQDVFNRLKDVSKWWEGNDLEGKSTNLNDEFTITNPSAHYSKQKLVEVVAVKL